MKNFITAVVLFTCALLNAQNDKPTREAFELKLSINNEQYYGMQVEKAPYFVKEKVLQIYPGEKLFIEAEVKDDVFVSMKVVERNLNPDKTIELNFYQNVEDKKHQQMYLTIKNPFNKKLNFNASMYIVGGDDWYETSIIPVFPGLTNYEMWNDVIISLVLNNWRLEGN
jgi:hypothetical protein